MERFAIEDIKKSIQCCYDKDCVNCPNNEELGSGNIVCLGRLLPKIESCINDLQHQLAVKDKALKLACKYNFFDNRKRIFFNDSNTEIDNWEDLLKFAINVAEKELKE